MFDLALNWIIDVLFFGSFGALIGYNMWVMAARGVQSANDKKYFQTLISFLIVVICSLFLVVVFMG